MAGNATGLARGERAIGLDSRAVALVDPQLGYRADLVLAPGRAGFARRERARLRLLRMALREADVVHFNFGSTAMPVRVVHPRGRAPRAWAWWFYAAVLAQHDLPLLRAAGKVIAVTFQGDDARQRDASLERFEITAATEVGDDYYPPGSDSLKRRAIRRFDRHADLIYALNPDLLHTLPARARFLPYASVDPGDFEPRYPSKSGPLVVAHAPTNRSGKGTRHVLSALEGLREEGLEFELLLIEDVDHVEARRLLARADLLVDQLLIGWYGGVATEAMALGKPVLAYLREDDLGFLPSAMRDDLPVRSATPSTLRDALRSWLTVRRPELPTIGRRSREYVERWHSPRTVAAALDADYRASLARRGR